MAMTDPIADMLTRVRNANTAMHDIVKMPSSKMKESLAKILVREGYIAGYNSVRPEAKAFPRRCPLAITFCEPNIALIGTPLAEQKNFVTGEVDFSDQGRAKILGENHGRLHVYVDKQTGRITGAELAAPRGEHLAHLLVAYIQKGLTVGEILDLPFYHPVVEEGLRTAIRHAARQLSA